VSATGWSKRSRAASELRVGPWWPKERSRSVGSSILLLLHLLRLPPQQQLVVHTLIKPCNYAIPPLHPANKVVDSPQTNEFTISASANLKANHDHISPPIKQRRIISISQQQLSQANGSVVTTSSRIAAACARALPARAAHLSGWIHRLPLTALRAFPCT
jgi:hypothetical protein